MYEERGNTHSAERTLFPSGHTSAPSALYIIHYQRGAVVCYTTPYSVLSRST